jgi:uracil-DNA glycosylase
MNMNKQAALDEITKEIERNGKKYFITVHPAAGLRFPPLRETFEKDFQKLRDVLKSLG